MLMSSFDYNRQSALYMEIMLLKHLPGDQRVGIRNFNQYMRKLHGSGISNGGKILKYEEYTTDDGDKYYLAIQECVDYDKTHYFPRYYFFLTGKNKKENTDCLNISYFDMKNKHVELMNIESHPECIPYKRTHIGRILLKIFMMFLKKYKIKTVSFEDVSSKKMNEEDYKLYILHYLCHGTTWYDKMFYKEFPNMRITATYKSNKYNKIYTYSEIKAKYQDVQKIINDKYNGDCMEAYKNYSSIFDDVFGVPSSDLLHLTYTIELNQ